MTRAALAIGAAAEFALLVVILDALGASLALSLGVAFLLAASSVAVVAASRRGASSGLASRAGSLERWTNAGFVLVGAILVATAGRDLVRFAGLATIVAGLAGAAVAWLGSRRLRRHATGAKL
jgi:hypothetical protein